MPAKKTVSLKTRKLWKLSFCGIWQNLNVEIFQKFKMEAPEFEGPPVWVELNRKCEAKVIELFRKNEVEALSSNLIYIL